MEMNSEFDENNRPLYRCNICDKTFRHENSYVLHKNVHTGSTKCPICDKILCRKYEMKVHMQNLHGIDKIPRKKKQPAEPKPFIILKCPE